MEYERSLHRGMGRVEIFSRESARNDDISGASPTRARQFKDEIILDGEIMAFEHGRS